MKAGWVFPELGFVNVNVHSVFYDPPIPNGNTTGVGVVICNSEGHILAMITGTLGHINQRVISYGSWCLGFNLLIR